MKYTVLMICLLLLRLCAPGQYQAGLFTKFTVADGLSDNIIQCISQDDNGFIWVATSSGLNRFDGRVFDQFYAEPGSVSGNLITKIIRFSGNKTGIITTKGFSVMDNQTCKTIQYPVPGSTPLELMSNKITDAAELPGNRYAFISATGFYVVSENGGFLYRYEHFLPQDYSENKKRIFFGNDIFTVTGNDYLLYYQDIFTGHYNAAGNKLVLNNPVPGTGWENFAVSRANWTIKKQINRNEFLHLSFSGNNIRYYNHQTGRSVITPLPFSAGQVMYWDSYISFINDTLFAINLREKGFYLWSLDRKSGRVRVNTNVLLPEYTCSSFFADSQARLWIGTNEGLLMQRTEPAFFKTTVTGNGHTAPGVSSFNNCIYKHDGKLFIGRYANRNGLLILDGQTGSLIKTVDFYGGDHSFNSILCMQMYHPDTLWVSSAGGLVWLNTKNCAYGKVLHNGQPVRGMLIMGRTRPNYTAWCCGYLANYAMQYDILKRQFTVYTGKTSTSFPLQRPKHIINDSYGNVWLAGHGLCRWNEEKQLFDTLITRFAGKYPLETNISSITADQSGGLWLSTADNGLLHYQIAEHKWVPYSSENGLPNGIIGSFSPVINNQFWMGAGTQMVHVDIPSKTFSLFGPGTGLPGKNLINELNEYYYDAAENKMYMVFFQYLTSFAATIDKNSGGRKIWIKKAAADNLAPVHFPGDTLALSYRQNQVSLEAGIIDFDAGKNYVYKYRMDGHTGWNDMGLRPIIFLNRLEPGRHRIYIKAVGGAASSSEKMLLVIVRPPFWKTAWFYLLCGLALAAGLYAVYRIRVGQIRKRALVNQHLAEFELKALHAQMNPHFIFNCLNSIKGLIINNQNKEASQYLNKFSSLVRQNLAHSRTTFITLKENIEYLRQYIEIENLRYGSLHYEILIDEGLDTDEISIAPMLLQPLVENAVWHGLSRGTAEKKLIIRVQRRQNRVTCSVEDNGIGIVKSLGYRREENAPPVGLKNIEERILLLNQKFGLDYQLAITDKSAAGTGATGTIASLQFTIKHIQHDKGHYS
jgi:ligand-binding sensor domain-containing protein